MPPFDPTKPISDPTIFYPNGLWINNHSLAPKGVTVENANDDDPKTFALNAGSMKALNRFLGTGQLLQTTRYDYLRWLGVEDVSGEVSDDLGKEVDILVATFTKIKADCTNFRNVTWEKILAVAGGIKSHAAMSGGKVSTSYYTLMLQYIGKLHDENDKPKPDENKVNEYQAVIVALAKDELKRIQSLIDGAEECKKGLRDFEVKSTLHSSEVQKNMTALSNQLTDENTDVDSLKVKMKDLQEKIDETNTNIDYKNKQISTGPAYMWIFPIGTFVGTGIVIAAQAERHKLQSTLTTYKTTMESYEGQFRVATRLMGNITAVTAQVSGLKEQIQPAIQTLQLLQGAWGVMKADLTTIKDLVELDVDRIPPMLVAPNMQQGIVNEWNELKDYVTKYIEVAYLTPPEKTLKDYLDDLKKG